MSRRPSTGEYHYYYGAVHPQNTQRTANPVENYPRVPVQPAVLHQAAANRYPHTVAAQPVQMHPIRTNTPVDLSEAIINRLMSALGPVLTNHHQATTSRLARLEESIETLSNRIAAAQQDIGVTRKESTSQIKEVAQYLERSYTKQVGVMKMMRDRVQGLENAIGGVDTAIRGVSFGGPVPKPGTGTLMDRLNRIEFTLGEMLEEAKDPNAHNPPVNPVLRHDMATSPVKGLRMDMGVGSSPSSTPKHLSNPVHPRQTVSTGAGPHSPIEIEDDDGDDVFLPGPSASTEASKHNHPTENVSSVSNMQPNQQASSSKPGPGAKANVRTEDEDDDEISEFQDSRLDVTMRSASPTAIHTDSPGTSMSSSPMLVPADWSAPHHDLAASISSSIPSGQFQVRKSAERENDDTPDDNTIAFLRKKVLGDSTTVTFIPDPHRPTEAYHYCPEVNALPSPVHSPTVYSSVSPAPLSMPEKDKDASTFSTPIHIDVVAKDTLPAYSQEINTAPTPLARDESFLEEFSVSQLIAASSPTASRAVSASSSTKANSVSPIVPSPALYSPVPTRDSLSPPPALSLAMLTQSPSNSPYADNLSPLSSISTDDNDEDALPANHKLKSKPNSNANANVNTILKVKEEQAEEIRLQQKETHKIKMFPHPGGGGTSVSISSISKAATRVKKRKARVSAGSEEEEAEAKPSTKRTKRRMKSESEMPSSQPVVLKRRRRTVKAKDRSKEPQWPVVSTVGTEGFLRKYIRCDGCSCWYHYACVGIVQGDYRLEPSETFYCPFCVVSEQNPREQSLADREVCARPDCAHNAIMDDVFFVSGIVGRRNKVEGGRGRRYIWLVKWDGYPIKDATWETEDSMTDPVKLIEDFNRAAKAEGILHDAHSTIFLREAREGGWRDPDE